MSNGRGHEPERQCVACRKMFKKSELIRIVRTPEGTAEIDSDGRKQGRGAYLCNDKKCIEKALRKGMLAKALHCRIPQEEAERIERDLI